MGKVSLTTEQLEEIKQTSFNSGIASNQGHAQASEETKEMFKNLRTDFKEMMGEIRRKIDENKIDTKEDLKAIIEAQKYTNGNVKNLLSFKDKTTGSLRVVYVMFALIIIPLGIFMVENYISKK